MWYGLKTALGNRFGRDVSSQIKLTGVSGQDSHYILNNFYSMVEKYEPLYVVYVVGTNDCGASSGTPTMTQAQFVQNSKELALRSAAIGAIPIFVSPNPVTTTSSETSYVTCHAYRDAQRRALLNMVGGSGSPEAPIGDAQFSVKNATITGVTYRSCAVTAAATVSADGCNVMTLDTTTATITTINTCDAPNAGRTLIGLCPASGSPAFATGGNIHLVSSPFTCTANDTITFICDGSIWRTLSSAVQAK
jgi:hypothetical protein